MNEETLRDVVIIGGGPAGLSCALYTARGKLSTVVLDRSPGAGALAVASKVANYPGSPGNTGPQLLDTMREQACEFGADYRRGTVMAVELESDPKRIYTNDEVYSARSVVVATGSRGRVQRIPGEVELTGRGVSICATCDAPFVQGKSAAVVGYDEIALEESLFLTRFASEVHLLCPRAAVAASVDLLQEASLTPNLHIHLLTRTLQVEGPEAVTGVVIESEGAQLVLPVSNVFLLLAGAAPIVDFLAGSLRLTPQGCIDVDCNCGSSIPGVYAVGDVTCIHPKQAIIAAAEGVIAALQIDRFLSGRDRARVDYL